MEKEFEFEIAEETKLQNGIRARLIETSCDILEGIHSGDIDAKRAGKENAELFYTREILKFLPDYVDGLCLYLGRGIIREELEDESRDNMLIWGPRDLKKHVRKLKRSRNKRS
jgi:hypothetical protein